MLKRREGKSQGLLRLYEPKSCICFLEENLLIRWSYLLLLYCWGPHLCGLPHPSQPIALTEQCQVPPKSCRTIPLSSPSTYPTLVIPSIGYPTFGTNYPCVRMWLPRLILNLSQRSLPYRWCLLSGMFSLRVFGWSPIYIVAGMFPIRNIPKVCLLLKSYVPCNRDVPDKRYHQSMCTTKVCIWSGIPHLHQIHYSYVFLYNCKLYMFKFCITIFNLKCIFIILIF